MKRLIKFVCFLAGVMLTSSTIGYTLPDPGAVSMGDGPYAEATRALPDPQQQALAGLNRPNLSELSRPKIAFSLLPKPHVTSKKPKTLSLKEAILLALRTNPDVENSELQRVTDKFALEVAHNFYVPQFSVTGSANLANGQIPSYNIGPQVTVTSPIGTTITAAYGNGFLGSPGEVTVTLKQPLLKGAGWDYNTSQLANAVDTESIAKLTFKNSIISVVVGVINAYRTLVQDYNSLAIQRNTLTRAQEQVKQAKLEVDAGKSAPNDLLQQESNLATTKLAMLQQQKTLQQDYQNFLQSLGLNANANIAIDKTIDFKYQKIPSLKGCINIALENNIDYQTALIQLRSSKRALMQARNESKWQLDLTASTTVGANTGTTTVPAGTSPSGSVGTFASSGQGPSVGFELDIPFNDIKAKQAVINAEVALEQAKLSLNEKKLQLVRTVTTQYNQVQQQYEQIKAAMIAVEIQQKTLKNSQIKLKYGKTTVFENNQLQDQLLQQKTSLVSDKIQYLNDITTLYQTLGLTLKKWGIKLKY